MASRVKKHFDLLKVLRSADPKLRTAILKHCSNDTVRCLCDCVFNVLSGNLKLTPKQKKQLVRFKCALRQLASRSLPLNKKRNVLVQHGGLVSAVLTPLLAIAATLLADKLSR